MDAWGGGRSGSWSVEQRVPQKVWGITSVLQKLEPNAVLSVMHRLEWDDVLLRRVGDEQVDEEVRGVMRQVQHAIKPLTINDNAREVGNAHNHVEDMDVLVIDQGPRCEQAGPPSSSRVGASFPIAIMCVLKEPKPSHGAREEGPTCLEQRVMPCLGRECIPIASFRVIR